MANTYNEDHKVLNIGIFAHVDAGKTTITEHLLYRSGVIKKTGRVDHGDTITDSMAQEIKRGITIQAQPVSFPINDIKVNLIDTPGHADFVAEVERSMQVLDGAILVLSAKEGVQAHTYLLFHSLKKLKIPFIIFINKIDRLGAEVSTVLNEIRNSLSTDIVCIQDVFSVGSKDAAVSPLFQFSEQKISGITEMLADHDELIMDDFLNNREIAESVMIDSIKSLSQKGLVHPVLFGSALADTGIESLMQGIEQLLPHNRLNGSGDSGFRVFKIKRTAKQDKQYYVKVDHGTVTVRDSVGQGKISRVEVLSNGKELGASGLFAGDIGVIYGVDLDVGDSVGNVDPRHSISLGTPTFKTAVFAVESEQRPMLIEGINRIAEADPFLEYEQHENFEEIYLNFFGEVQMEIVKDVLLADYGVEVRFKEQTVIYRESPASAAEARMNMFTDENPYCASIAIKVEPGMQGSGIAIKSDVQVGEIPSQMWNGIYDGIYSALRQGLKGWEVTDTIVTITWLKHETPTTPADFRGVTPMVVLEALDKAGTRLLWPILDFDLKLPDQFYGKAVSDLLKMKAEFSTPERTGEIVMIKGSIPVETSKKYSLELTDYTGGKGLLATWFSCYAPADPGVNKERKKIYPDPLNRTLYLMSKRGRV